MSLKINIVIVLMFAIILKFIIEGIIDFNATNWLKSDGEKYGYTE